MALSARDLEVAVDALIPLGTLADDDPRWSRIAEPTDWTAQRSLEHITDALLFYAGQVARRADRPLPDLREGRSGRPSEHLELVRTAAAVLAVAVEALG